LGPTFQGQKLKSHIKLKCILCRKKKVVAELKQRKQNYKKSVDDLRQRQTRLEGVRGERVHLFMRCFEHISAEIDSIYKARLLHTVLSCVITSARAI